MKRFEAGTILKNMDNSASFSGEGNRLQAGQGGRNCFPFDDYSMAIIPLPFSSKIRSEIASRNAPAELSETNRAEPSLPNLSVMFSAATPEPLTIFSPSV